MGNVPVDIVGKRIGKLTAIRRTDVKYRGSYLWIVQCDCGAEKLISASKFNTGIYKSCGCSRAEKLCRKIAYQGKRYSVKKFSELTGIHTSIVYRKLKEGFCANDIAKKITLRHKDYGLAKPTTLIEMARVAGVTRQAIMYRIKHGWKGYELITPPQRRGRCRKVNANYVGNN